MSWGCLTRLTYTIKLLQVQQEMQLAVCLGERSLWQKSYCGIRALLLGTNYYSSKHAPELYTLIKESLVKDKSFKVLILSTSKAKKKKKNQLPRNTKVIFRFCFSIEFLEHKSNLKMVPSILIYVICKHHC